VVDLSEKCFEYYDSLGWKPPEYGVSRLKGYVYVKSKHVIDANLWPINPQHKIPQQKNSYDCGVFCMLYASYLSINKSFDWKPEVHFSTLTPALTHTSAYSHLAQDIDKRRLQITQELLDAQLYPQ
jgi:Ulp1 family protease